MIKLTVKAQFWSDTKESQRAYDRGRHDQAEEDADAIRQWLVETSQIKAWLSPEIEIVKDEEDEPE